MNAKLSNEIREHVIRGLAKHRLELRDAYHGAAREAVLSTLAQYTGGIDPVARAQFFDTVTSQMQILSALDDGGDFADDVVRMAYGIDYPNVRDLERLEEEAGADYEDALGHLLAGRRLSVVA